MEDKEFVTVASFSSEVELRVARSLLESEGIMTYVPLQYLVGAAWGSSLRRPTGSKWLQTPASQAGLARALLAAMVNDADLVEASGGVGDGEEVGE